MKLQDLIEAQIKSAGMLGYICATLEAIGKEATKEGGKPETQIFSLHKKVQDFIDQNYLKLNEK